jgi:hypothetical protein
MLNAKMLQPQCCASLESAASPENRMLRQPSIECPQSPYTIVFILPLGHVVSPIMHLCACAVIITYPSMHYYPSQDASYAATAST